MKYTCTLTIKCDEQLLEAIDAFQRAREAELRMPLSRSLTVRQLLEERLGLHRSGARARDNGAAADDQAPNAPIE